MSVFFTSNFNVYFLCVHASRQMKFFIIINNNIFIINHTSTTFLLRMLFRLLSVFRCRTITGSALCTRGRLFMFGGGNTSLRLGCPPLILSCLKELMIQVVDKLYPYTWYILSIAALDVYPQWT
jgi:hypothetical protein